MKAHVSLSGLVFAPTRVESYDFTAGDGKQIVGRYFATDVIQVTSEGKTLLVTIRSEYPLVETPKAGEVLEFDCILDVNNGRAKLTYAPPKSTPSPNGDKSAASARS